MVSIIIPHFNRLQLLNQAIESVIRQTSNDWEIIIVDDQSTPMIFDEVKKLQTQKIGVLQRSSDRLKGPSSCRNIGIENAKGEYVIFLDSDDLLEPACVEDRMDIVKQFPQLDCAVFQMRELNASGEQRAGIYNKDIPPGQFIDAFIANDNPWNVTCPIWKKQALHDLGGFDEAMFYMEDPDIHLRALYAGKKIKTFYELPPDCFYRIHNIDDTKISFWDNSIKYRIQFYEKITSGFYSSDFIKEHKYSIKAGVSQLVRTFLYTRANVFPSLVQQLLQWMERCGLFSAVEILRYKWLLKIGNTENPLLQKMKLKGLCFKMLPSV